MQCIVSHAAFDDTALDALTALRDHKTSGYFVGGGITAEVPEEGVNERFLAPHAQGWQLGSGAGVVAVWPSASDCGQASSKPDPGWSVAQNLEADSR